MEICGGSGDGNGGVGDGFFGIMCLNMSFLDVVWGWRLGIFQIVYNGYYD